MFAPKAVESVSDIIGDDGSVTVTYVYDVSKLGKDAEEIGTKGFSTTYFSIKTVNLNTSLKTLSQRTLSTTIVLT